jgi:TRAP-type C4-dicarboxylate transport system permease large subunit
MDRTIIAVLPFMWAQLIVLGLLIVFPDIVLVPLRLFYGG